MLITRVINISLFFANIKACYLRMDSIETGIVSERQCDSTVPLLTESTRP